MSSFSKYDDRCYHSLKILLLFLTTVLNKRCYIFAKGNERRLESKTWYFQSVSLSPLKPFFPCFMSQLNEKNNLYTRRKSSFNRDISNKDLICLLIKSMAENDSAIFATGCGCLTIFQFLIFASLFISIFYVVAVMSFFSK